MATMAFAEIQCGGELKSWVPDFSSNGTVVNRLCQEGKLKEAVHLLELLVQQNNKAPIKAYVGLLKGCARMKALAEGKRVHALIVRNGLDSRIFLGKSLIHMYAKCGSLFDARKVFDTMPEHNVSSWTAIISAYSDHKQGDEAIRLFQQMQQTGIAPDKVAFVVILKACARVADLEEGKLLHSDLIRRGFQSDVIVGNTLVAMYAKCGCIDHARQLFDRMSERNVVSWSSMIAGYAQNGLCKDALALYTQMKHEDVQPNSVTYVVLLKACASIAALEQGKQLHSLIRKSGFETNVIVASALIDMYAKCSCIELASQVFKNMSKRDVVTWNSMLAGYAKCGRIKDAREVFNKMNERDVVSWNAMIGGYAQHGLGREAFALYGRMKQEGLEPDNVTYVLLLKACASIADLEQGKQLHAHITKGGFESDVIVGSSLVEMYAKCGCIDHAYKVFSGMSERTVVTWNSMISGYANCGSIEKAHEVFKDMKERNLVSWNVIIAGYAQHGLGKEALALYEQMKQEHVRPDDVTCALLLKACASIAALEQGKQLHSLIIQSGFESNVIVSSALVDMYAKCGCIEDARQVFNKMNNRDAVSWSAMIAGYTELGLGKEALALYEQMKQEGMQLDNITFALLLNACASIAALEQGKQLHSHIMQSGFELDVIVGSALVDMYAKCGCIEHAHWVFNKLNERDVVLWNALIMGYAQQGLGKEVLSLLTQMQREGVKPDEVTYVSVLSACSHSGLVAEGRHLFDSMCKDHGVTPTIKHYACMVDLLGRAGFLADAEEFINKMSIQPNAMVWMTLLGAARIHDHLEIGRRAFECVLKLEPENHSAYVLLSNIYAAAGRLDEVAKKRQELKDVGSKEVLGYS